MEKEGARLVSRVNSLGRNKGKDGKQMGWKHLREFVGTVMKYIIIISDTHHLEEFSLVARNLDTKTNHGKNKVTNSSLMISV